MRAGGPLRFDQRVVSLHQDAGSVTVSTAAGESVTGAYAVGADGARSTVRKSLGVKLLGKAASNRFLTADIKVALPIAKERLFYYSPSYSPGLRVLTPN